MSFAHLKWILKLDRLQLRGPSGVHDRGDPRQKPPVQLDAKRFFQNPPFPAKIRPLHNTLQRAFELSSSAKFLSSIRRLAFSISSPS